MVPSSVIVSTIPCEVCGAKVGEYCTLSEDKIGLEHPIHNARALAYQNAPLLRASFSYADMMKVAEEVAIDGMTFGLPRPTAQASEGGYDELRRRLAQIIRRTLGERS